MKNGRKSKKQPSSSSSEKSPNSKQVQARSPDHVEKEHAENDGTGHILADGYYEIEGIRQVRARKGRLQYLIKWKGWPETANTWEPYENIKYCTLLLDAFKEQQQKLRKKKSKSKSKSKSISSGKSTVSSLETLQPPTKRRRTSPPSLDPSSPDKPEPEANGEAGGDPKCDENKNTFHNKSKMTSVPENEPCPENQLQEQHAEEKEECQPPPVTVEPTADDACKVDDHAPSPSSQGPVTGAKRRKSGSVKRFIQDALPVGDNGCSAGEGVGSTPCQTSSENKLSGCIQESSIVKIIKPVSYYAALSSDNLYEVSITFKALRSDGKEVTVSNKELRSNCPLVLIDFYEQHLRYNPNAI